MVWAFGSPPLLPLPGPPSRGGLIPGASGDNDILLTNIEGRTDADNADNDFDDVYPDGRQQAAPGGGGDVDTSDEDEDEDEDEGGYTERLGSAMSPAGPGEEATGGIMYADVLQV